MINNVCGSNLIPIFIIILCCSGLFMYFNVRLNEIKNTVEKQNRVLTSFITNVQQDIKSGGCMMQPPLPADNNHFAAPEAIIAAKQFANEKIVVSDDESDTSDDDDDSSRSSSDSETDDDDDEGETNKKNIKLIKVPDLNIEQILAFEVLPNLANPAELGVTELGANELGVTELGANELGANELSITEVKVEPLNLVEDVQTYEQMRVDDLRKIVSDKSLATKEEVKKLKKPELLIMLKK